MIAKPRGPIGIRAFPATSFSPIEKCPRCVRGIGLATCTKQKRHTDFPVCRFVLEGTLTQRRRELQAAEEARTPRRPPSRTRLAATRPSVAAARSLPAARARCPLPDTGTYRFPPESGGR